MRVIGGSVGGITLVAPRGSGTRPITDMVKEALFAIIGERAVDARVLDLYAGSGAIAIEALSRGAASAVLVERARPALVAIAANLARTDFTGHAQVIAGRVEEYLARPGGAEFDLVFVDPPYDNRATLVVVGNALSRLRPGGWLVVKHFWKNDPGDVTGTSRLRVRRFGETALTFLERIGEQT
jgi:16S rRNA (guanine(966)-N(2))-methyltransferase RsmD